MNKIDPQNERLKFDYQDRLRHAQGLDQKTIDKAMTAIRQFEESTNCKPFKKFKKEQAMEFKDWLATAKNKRTGKPLSLSTINSTLRAVREFFRWVSDLPGLRGAIGRDAWEYFKQPRKEARAANRPAQRMVPSVDHVKRAFDAMPDATSLQKRDKALLAFLILTGARIAAVGSLRLKHVNLEERHVSQDAREVNTKHAKTMNTTFFPMGECYVDAVVAYLNHLKEDLMFGPEDPIFPKSGVSVGANGFENAGLLRAPFAGTGPLCTIVKEAFATVQLPAYTPHSFRHMLALHGDKVCKTREEFKAWSQNMGHDNVNTTISAYMPVSEANQHEIILNLGKR